LQLIAAYLDAVIRKDASAVDRYFDPIYERSLAAYLSAPTPSSAHA
jgi:hypothetical protein